MKQCPKHINVVLHTDTNKSVYKIADWAHHVYDLWVKPFLSQTNQVQLVDIFVGFCNFKKMLVRTKSIILFLE